MMQQQVPYNLFEERPIVEIKVQVLRGKARELLLRIEMNIVPSYKYESFENVFYSLVSLSKFSGGHPI